MKRLCIYATIGKQTEQVRGRYVTYALKKYRDVADCIVVVTDIRADHPNFHEINEVADRMVRSPSGQIGTSLEGYRLGLAERTLKNWRPTKKSFLWIVLATAQFLRWARSSTIRADHRLISGRSGTLPKDPICRVPTRSSLVA